MAHLSTYFCPRCGSTRRFKSDGDYSGSNRFCPKDGTLLRPQGWTPPKSSKQNLNREPDSVPVTRRRQGKKVKLGEIADGMMNLQIVAKVVSKRLSGRSARRPHAIAMISDGTNVVPLHLWIVRLAW